MASLRAQRSSLKCPPNRRLAIVLTTSNCPLLRAAVSVKSFYNRYREQHVGYRLRRFLARRRCTCASWNIQANQDIQLTDEAADGLTAKLATSMRSAAHPCADPTRGRRLDTSLREDRQGLEFGHRHEGIVNHDVQVVIRLTLLIGTRKGMIGRI